MKQQKAVIGLDADINALTRVIVQLQSNAVSLCYIHGATLRDFIALRKNTIHTPFLVYLSLPSCGQRRSNLLGPQSATIRQLCSVIFNIGVHNKRLGDKIC